MPPVRRKNVKGISNRSNRSQSTAANSDTESLQRQCTERGYLTMDKRMLQSLGYNSTQPLRLRGQR